MYYIVEIHDKESEELGCLMHEENGQMVPTRFDSFSKAKVQAAIIKKELKATQYTNIVSFESDSASSEEQ